MTVTTSIPGFPSYLPQKVIDVPKEIIRTFNHSKKVGNYLLGKTLGEGSFAKVKEALHIPTGEKVAIKVIDKKRAKEDHYVRKNLRREGKILQMVRHPNVVQLYEIMETENSYYLVTELCKGGDFMDYICQRKKLEERDVKKFIRQIILAIDYLHRLGILHRDLKIENLLLDENENIKIIDFGLSNTIRLPHYKDSVMHPNNFLTTQCGSPAYAAPELLGKRKYGAQVDVWSIGVNMHAMLTGNLPFTVDPFNIKSLYNKMLAGQSNPLPEDVSKECKDLVKRLLIPDPDKRISLVDAMKHPWITCGKGMAIDRSLCPNKIKSDEIDENIVKHMSESHGFRTSEVIRYIIGNTPSPALTLYLILHDKLRKYMADMRVKGKVSAMESQINGKKKIAIIFQKLHAQDRGSEESYPACSPSPSPPRSPATSLSRRPVHCIRKKSVDGSEKNEGDIRLTDIDGETEDDKKAGDSENIDILKPSSPKLFRCRTSHNAKIPKSVETKNLPKVPMKFTGKPITLNAQVHRVNGDSTGAKIFRPEARSPSPPGKVLYRPVPQQSSVRTDRPHHYLWEDSLPMREGVIEEREQIGRKVLKRCNTDLNLPLRTKACAERPCLPDSITHQLFNGQNTDYIRRTEVKVINNRKLIHMDFAPCHKRGQKRDQLTLNSRFEKKDKSAMLRDRMHVMHIRSPTTPHEDSPAPNRQDLCSTERVTPLSASSNKPNSVKDNVSGTTLREETQPVLPHLPPST